MSRNPVARVVIRGMGTNRGPGTIKAVITDAANLGASTYYNAGGEFHMTLPTNHPQVGHCEPWTSHYAVEEYVAGRGYIERFAGILSDFDANQDDIIIYGIDYLALLDKVIDTRYVQGQPEADWSVGGSKFSNLSLRTIVRNLINYARDKADSPVEFIVHDGALIEEMAEKVTIYTTFTAVRSMIDGLVESHRQGTGKRTRFWVQRYGDQQYRYRLQANPGVDRNNLRMEYGGLIQGFQVVGFGEFAVKAHGIGRTQTGFELFYKSANAPGMSPSTWGSIETVSVHDNVTDANDLLRRVKQAAASAGKVGKRIALGIRVEHLSPFDGYEIADNVPVHIKRGVIDTTRWGSGLWSIYGVEWRVKQDGHTETSLILSPKEDGVKPNPDLLANNPVLPAPIETARIADGAINTSKLADGAVTNPILAAQAVSGDKVEDDAIGTTQMAPLSVDHTVLAPNAVDTDNFAVAAKAPLAGTSDNALIAAVADTAIAVQNVPAEVIIDADGLTILNGKISLLDESGATVMTASGFQGPWLSFIKNGLYNSQFADGTPGNLVYTPSYPGPQGSVELPYWFYHWRFNASNLATLAVSALATSGKYVDFTANVVNGTYVSQRLASTRVPVSAGQSLSVRAQFSVKKGTPAKPVWCELGVYWYDANGVFISSAVEATTAYALDDPLGTWRWGAASLTAPDLAALAVISIGAGYPTGTNADTGMRIGEVGVSLGTQSIRNISFDGTLDMRRFVDGIVRLSDPFEHYSTLSLAIKPMTGATGQVEVHGTDAAWSSIAIKADPSAVPSIQFGPGSSGWDSYIYREGPNKLRADSATSLYGSVVGRHLVKSSGINISNATYTVITSWSTTPFLGLGVTYDGVDELVVDRAGLYMIYARCDFASSATGIRILGYDVNDVGATGPSLTEQHRFPVNADGNADIFTAMWPATLSAGDRICLKVYQNSGGTLLLNGANLGVFFMGYAP